MKKNRSTLKDYFKKGAIPTESNFADLIDSMLNQEEDNISKLPNDPLKITAIGVDEALVNFYRVENNAEQLSWQVKQKLGGVAGLTAYGADETTRDTTSPPHDRQKPNGTHRCCTWPCGSRRYRPTPGTWLEYAPRRVCRFIL